jgi:hypothetical protein
MQFNDTSGGQGLIQTCEHNCKFDATGISASTSLMKKFTSLINRAYEKAIAFIFNSTGCWIYDDSNASDLPIARANLVNGTAIYTLPDAALTIERLDILTASGKGKQLVPISKSEVGISLEEFESTDGEPQYFSVDGEIVTLYPAPNYDYTKGLILHHRRMDTLFTTSSTTTTPGFASFFHEYLAIIASLKYLKIYVSDSPAIVSLDEDKKEMEEAIKNYYSKRFGVKRKVITRRKESFK